MSVVFNVAKGREAYYASLPAANDALIAVFLEATGLEADATMPDHDTLAAVLAGTSVEQTTFGRATLTGVTVTVNDTDNQVEVDADDFTVSSTAGNPVGAVLICYDPDTTGGTDADIVPITKHDYTITPDGTDLLVQIAGIVTAA